PTGPDLQAPRQDGLPGRARRAAGVSAVSSAPPRVRGLKTPVAQSEFTGATPWRLKLRPTHLPLPGRQVRRRIQAAGDGMMNPEDIVRLREQAQQWRQRWQ